MTDEQKDELLENSEQVAEFVNEALEEDNKPELQLTHEEMVEILGDLDKLKAFAKKMEEQNPQPPMTRDERIIKTLTDNTKLHLQSQRAMRADTENSMSDVDAVFGKDPTDFIRMIVEAIGIRDCIGVQPMQSPVGLAFSLQYRYADKKASAADDGDNLGGITGRKMTLDVISQAVEAGSRKLRAGWTIEAASDLNSLYGLDIEQELRHALATEIGAEFNDSIYLDLQKLATSSTEDTSWVDLEADNAKDALLVEINRQASTIARLTRRGSANFIVVSPTVLAYLQEVAGKLYVQHTSESDEPRSSNFLLAGHLNAVYRVYCHMNAPDDQILLGYNGTNEIDTGFTFMPYVPVMSSGVVVDPHTFQPRVSLMSRYGLSVHHRESLSDSHNYYRVIKLENAPWTPDAAEDVVEDTTTNPIAEYEKHLETQRTEFVLDRFERAMDAVEGFKNLLN